MNALERLARTSFPELVLAGCALAFAGVLYELIGYQHYEKGTQIIGFVATIAGLIFTLLGFVRAAAVRTTTLIVLPLLAVVGVVGVFEHSETRREDAAKFAARQAQVTTTGTVAGATPSEPAAPAGAPAGGPQGGPPGGGPFRSNIPVLAPLAVSGLSALAFLTVLARRRDLGADAVHSREWPTTT
ncbi:hypothetical protein E7T09_00750 [Deinococcus sp. KSM4-11]|uniref:hypothetical protein n=1 Tax=Deinococcus sp. KSM4-11 TaxID=2568654 RepID=UPI0010A36F60|nr:hypothetical protein [Deinococcus sp. KSM4-11]THF87804.1 hypothetical protein E7T09_00750 [Deinococcus sp. KSM4-11]